MTKRTRRPTPARPTSRPARGTRRARQPAPTKRPSRARTAAQHAPSKRASTKRAPAKRAAAKASAATNGPTPHAGGGSAGEGKPDQLTVCTQHCGARCCRYVTVKFPAPKSEIDWDEVRWWLAHEGIVVSQDEDGWMLHMYTRCKNLKADNACGIYPDHMLACKEYDPADCEFTGEVPFYVKLEQESDLATYLERRRLKRGRAVAASIRRAARRRKASAKAPGLVVLAPLTPLTALAPLAPLAPLPSAPQGP